MPHTSSGRKYVENRYCAYTKLYQVESRFTQSTKHKAQSTKHKTQNTKQEIPVNKINPGDVDIGQTVCGGEGSFSDLVSFYVT